VIYGSVCSGIEAATVAWHPLGWKAAFFSEIEKFPRAVLAYHYPDVPCHGDFTTIKSGEYDAIDLLVGGTPCQDFSVAGLRKGISGERGNLTLEFIRLAERLKPRFLVWENVPGVLSIDGGRAFGAFLGGLAECGYGFSWRILDAQYFGVPQRRRRVFVVGHLGDWRPAAAVLFERESLRGDITPRRETGEEVAGTIAKCSFSGGAGGRPEGAAAGHSHAVCYGLDEEQNAHENLMGCLKSREKGGGFEGAVACFKGGQGSKAGGIGYDENLSPTLGSADSGTNRTPTLMCGMRVRRLMPTECEFLQGFPRNYTKINANTADGPRYKALGNSMAVPVMAWIGRRIESIDAAEAI
jgi:DNA (cytosine-5)-methyltransferase 1